MTTSAPASRNAAAHRIAFSWKNGSSVPANEVRARKRTRRHGRRSETGAGRGAEDRTVDVRMDESGSGSTEQRTELGDLSISIDRPASTRSDPPAGLEPYGFEWPAWACHALLTAARVDLMTMLGPSTASTSSWAEAPRWEQRRHQNWSESASCDRVGFVAAGSVAAAGAQRAGAFVAPNDPGVHRSTVSPVSPVSSTGASSTDESGRSRGCSAVSSPTTVPQRSQDFGLPPSGVPRCPPMWPGLHLDTLQHQVHHSRGELPKTPRTRAGRLLRIGLTRCDPGAWPSSCLRG
jgi:hypothetical protein